MAYYAWPRTYVLSSRLNSGESAVKQEDKRLPWLQRCFMNEILPPSPHPSLLFSLYWPPFLSKHLKPFLDAGPFCLHFSLLLTWLVLSYSSSLSSSSKTSLITFFWSTTSHTRLLHMCLLSQMKYKCHWVSYSLMCSAYSIMFGTVCAQQIYSEWMRVAIWKWK